jgi:putative membrane protein
VTDPINAQLTYLNIWLCGVVVFLSEKLEVRTLFPFILIFLGGYLAELSGVHTGVLFGEYQYGEALGPSLFDIPVVMGMNWYATIVTSSAVAMRVVDKRWLQVLLSAILCVGLDLLIEPVAIRYDFWQWGGGTIPIQNYIAWFVFSLIFAAIYIFNTKVKNRTAAALWFIWLLFFFLLNF